MCFAGHTHGNLWPRALPGERCRLGCEDKLKIKNLVNPATWQLLQKDGLAAIHAHRLECSNLATWAMSCEEAGETSGAEHQGGPTAHVNFVRKVGLGPSARIVGCACSASREIAGVYCKDTGIF